ncbi:MAG: hypothetical protein Q8S84_03035 [bacterium]|nr:hypothetical protein [bacterium]MDP3380506.1 hypothetical protein [bacterium]
MCLYDSHLLIKSIISVLNSCISEVSVNHSDFDKSINHLIFGLFEVSSISETSFFIPFHSISQND